MSGGPPVLWLSTNAVQLTVPIGEDGQLMSGGSPVLWLSTNAVQFFCRQRRALFRSSFAFPFSVRQAFSVTISFLFSALQTFPLAFRSSFPFFFPLVTV